MHPREILHRSKLEKKYAVMYSQLKRKIPKTCPGCAKDKDVEIWSIFTSKYLINENISFTEKDIYNYSCYDCMNTFFWRSVSEYMYQFDIADKLIKLRKYNMKRYNSMGMSMTIHDSDKTDIILKRINKILNGKNERPGN